MSSPHPEEPPDRKPAGVDAPAVRRAPSRIVLLGAEPEPGAPFTVALEALRPGVEVRHAASLHDALAVLEDADAPRCALLDLSSTGSDGLRLVVELRRDLPDVPVVVLVGDEPEEEDLALQAIAAGAQDALVRSRLTPARLTRAIRRAVHRVLADEDPAGAADRFREVFDRAPVGMAVATADTVDPARITDANGALASLLGSPPEELAGRRLPELSHWEDRPELERALTDLIGGRTTGYRAERRLLHSSGEVVWCLVSASLIPGTAGPEGSTPSLVLSVQDVGALRRREGQLHDTLVALDRARVGSARFDVDGRCATVSAAFAEILGRPRETLLGTDWLEVVHPADRGLAQGTFEELKHGEGAAIEVRAVRGDGTTFDASLLMSEIAGPAGEHHGLQLFLRDIGDRLAARRWLEASEARYERLVETANEGVWTADAEGRITSANHKLAEMLGVRREQLVGRPVQDLLAKESKGRGGDQPLTPGDRVDVRLRREDGSELWALVSTARLPDEPGGPRTLAMVTDITDRKTLEHRLDAMASHDPLTGLPDRRIFEDRLRSALAGVEGSSGSVAVLAFDVDRFRSVTDRFGHAVGDALLCELARRMTEVLAPGTTLARLAGDGFVVLCENVSGEREAVMIARRLLGAAAEPFDSVSHPVHLTISVGVAVTSSSARSPTDLMRSADAAMARVKTRGGNDLDLIHPAMRARASAELELEADIRRALERDEFRLVFQPVLSVADLTLQSFEGLLRWHHPERGVLLPEEFLDIAERTGDIRGLDTWVLRHALHQLVRWAAEDGSWARIAINVSARRLADTGFHDRVRLALRESGVEPHRLTLEVTDTGSSAVAPPLAGALSALRDLGVRVVLDRFGAGSSALTHLRTLPLDGLKTDRVLVGGLLSPASTLPILEATLGMARAVGVPVIAGGVEDEDQLRILADLDCDLAQGSLFADPMSSDAVPAWVRHWATIRRADLIPEARSDEGTITMGEAATALGVSTSTLRRWIDEGRLRAHRTTGGHRRVPLSEVRRLGEKTGGPVRLRPVALPERPLPELATVLETSGDVVLQSARRALYDPAAPGWFASRRAEPVLRRWVAQLGIAAASGEYGGLDEVARDVHRQARMTASLLETQLFGERLATSTLHLLGGTERGRQELADARRLFAVLRQISLMEEGRA